MHVEIDANLRAGETVWRETGAGHGVTLAITEAGLAAIGIEPESAKPRSEVVAKAAVGKVPTKAPETATGEKKARGDKDCRPREEDRVQGVHWRDGADAPGRDEASDHDGHAPAQERRNDRRNRRGDGVAAAHHPRGVRRGR